MKYLLTTALMALCLGCLAQSNARMIGPNDPNNDPNWKWYQEYPDGLTMYYEVPGQENPVLVPAGKQTPFFTSGHPLNTVESKKDMWPEDGWVLAYRDFGTESSAPKQPFFILYNRYRGVLRYIFYNALNHAYSHYRAELFFQDPEFSGALMTFSDDEKAFLNDYDGEKTLNFLSKVAVLHGWGYADFQLFGFDPTMDVNSRMRIEVYGVDVSDVHLESTEFTLDQVLDDADLEGLRSSGETLESAFSAGQKVYKSSEKATKGLKDRVSVEQKKIDAGGAEPWWFSTLSDVANSSLLNAVPVIGGVAGFISSFFHSDDASPKPLKFQGSLKLEGSITTTQYLAGDDFILNPSASPTSQYYIPLNDLSLGVFNLLNKPIIRANYSLPNYPSLVYFYVFRLDNRLQYTFNHNAGLNLVSMKARYVFDNHPPFSAENPVLLETLAYGVLSQTVPGSNVNASLPSGISVELKFETESHKNNGSEITVLKTYPVELNYIANPNTFPPLQGVPDVIILNQQSDYKPYALENLALATNMIEAGNNFYVGGNLNVVKLMAVNQIVLKPGFRANLGSSFHAVTIPTFKDLQANGRSSSNESDQFELLHYPYFRQSNSTSSYSSDFKDLEVVYSKDEISVDPKERQSKLFVYPNPSEGDISIEYFFTSPSNETMIEVFDQHGLRVHNEKKQINAMGTYRIPLSLNKLSKGMYFLRVTSHEGYSSGRVFMIQ